MALEQLYFNISTARWIKSFDEPTDTNAPVVGHKDNRDFSVQFVRSLAVTAIEVVEDVVAAQYGLSDSSGNFLTSATAGAVDNNHFPFVLPVTSAAITTLMTGKTTRQQVNAEFKLTTAAGTNRFFTTAFIAPQILVDAVPDPAVTEPAATMSEVIGVCAQKERPQAGADIWTDRITGARYAVYVENRQFKFDELG